MAYSNHPPPPTTTKQLQYHIPTTTIPTFSPFYSSTIPPNYSTPTSIPNPAPHPNIIFPTSPSYPYHTHTPPSFTHSSHSCVGNNYNTTSPPPNQYTYQTFPSYPYHNHHSPYYYTITNNTTSPPANPYLTSSTPNTENCNYFQQQHQIHSHSQPVATIPNAEINQKALSEIVEVLKRFQDEINESHLAIKKSFQAISESLKSREKNLPKKMTEEATDEPKIEEKAEIFPSPKPSSRFSSTSSSPAAPPEHQKQRTVASFKTLKVRESASSGIKFLSETVSAPPPATRPPSKPPDVHSSPENFQFQPPVFLIAQSQPLAPLYSSTSPLINSLPRPPETVSSLLPASPPPLKPPDLHLPLEVFLPPPALLPPPKPPDRYFRRPKLLDVQPPYNFYRTAFCLSFVFLKNVKMENSTIDPCDIVVLHVKFGTTSQPLDHFIPILLQSQLCHKTTICLKPSQPTTNSHVSKFASPTTIHARDILFSPYFYVSARCLQVAKEFKSYCQLASIHVHQQRHIICLDLRKVGQIFCSG